MTVLADLVSSMSLTELILHLEHLAASRPMPRKRADEQEMSYVRGHVIGRILSIESEIQMPEPRMINIRRALDGRHA